jgi:hypothetical protein
LGRTKDKKKGLSVLFWFPFIYCLEGPAGQKQPFNSLINFSAVKQRLIQGYGAEKNTHLIELDVREPWVVSIFKKSEELRLCNLVKNLTISNPSLKAVSSNTSSG